MTKLYCYVDETGQDTKGKLFIVVIVVVEGEENIEDVTYLIEKQSGKDLKWNKSTYIKRSSFLELLSKRKNVIYRVYWSKYCNVKDYEYCKAVTIHKALLNSNKYKFAHIIIDGGSKKELNVLRVILKNLSIKNIKLKGGKDESFGGLRLSDTFAGLIRDAIEGKVYAKKFFYIFSKCNILIEV